MTKYLIFYALTAFLSEACKMALNYVCNTKAAKLSVLVRGLSASGC